MIPHSSVTIDYSTSLKYSQLIPVLTARAVSLSGPLGSNTTSDTELEVALRARHRNRYLHLRYAKPLHASIAIEYTEDT